MKTIGIIGGLGPESTVDYYKEIISSFNTKHADLAYPEIIIYSANLNEFTELVNTKQWQKISQNMHHRPFHPLSDTHQDFIRKTLAMIEQLPAEIDTTREVALLKSSLK